MGIPQRTSHESQESSWDQDKVKQIKGFKLVMDARNPEYFDGKTSALYLSWKVALEAEVSHLSLTSTQWMDLLKARTKGKAKEAVLRAQTLLLETSPDQAVEMAWRFLELSFKTPQKPSQEVFTSLVQGTKIAPGNSEDLMSLAQTCITAVAFMECSRGILPALNELVTQGTIIDRLPPQLKHKWHEYKYEVLGMDGAVPCDRLVSWIDRQANIARSETTQVSSTVFSSQPVGTANVAPVPQTSSTSVVPLQNTSPAISNVAPS